MAILKLEDRQIGIYRFTRTSDRQHRRWDGKQWYDSCHRLETAIREKSPTSSYDSTYFEGKVRAADLVEWVCDWDGNPTPPRREPEQMDLFQ